MWRLVKCDNKFWRFRIARTATQGVWDSFRISFLSLGFYRFTLSFFNSVFPGSWKVTDWYLDRSFKTNSRWETWNWISRYINQKNVSDVFGLMQVWIREKVGLSGQKQCFKTQCCQDFVRSNQANSSRKIGIWRTPSNNKSSKKAVFDQFEPQGFQRREQNPYIF